MDLTRLEPQKSPRIILNRTFLGFVFLSPKPRAFSFNSQSINNKGYKLKKRSFQTAFKNYGVDNGAGSAPFYRGID